MTLAREKWFTWFNLTTELRGSVIPAVWRRVAGTMIFAKILTDSCDRGFSVDKSILNTLK